MTRWMPVALFGLVACGPNVEQACTDYLTSIRECNTESCGDDTACQDLVATTYPDSVCDAYDGVKGDAAKTAADLFDCYATAISGGDCSTAEGYTAVATELAACVTGG